MKRSVPTLRDVAAAARVSTATVSKYINGIQRFSPMVEAALDAAIASLGYRANPLAKSMVTGRTGAIGLALPGLDDRHLARILDGARRTARAHGYVLILASAGETPQHERHTLEDLSRRVDGMIAWSQLPGQEMGWMARLGKPLVVCGALERPPPAGVGGVTGDDRGAARLLAEHLRMLGHRRLAYLGCSGSCRDARQLEGIRACVEASAGMALAVFDAAAPDAAEGERHAARIMRSNGRPDALICHDDLLAFGFMKAAAALGLSLPRDLSVVGIGNIPDGNYVTPALTTVDLQGERMGAVAMDKLLATLRGEAPEQLTRIAPQLVPRTSAVARRD